MDRFIDVAHYDLAALAVEDDVLDGEAGIRDAKDRPVLRAVRKASVNIFVTGDEDFLKSSATRTKILEAAQFM
ncbi:MAG: hypothetical protein LBU32_02785 [Clostridiales bacterium]|nr:hypothetical protein [Clostridiales bacterium]